MSRYCHDFAESDVKQYSLTCPTNTRRWPTAALMLVHRLRRWPNIKTTMSWYIISALVKQGPYRGVYRISGCITENTRRWPNAGLILGQRRRRWLSIKSALGQCLVFVGYRSIPVTRDVGPVLVQCLTRVELFQVELYTACRRILAQHKFLHFVKSV